MRSTATCSVRYSKSKIRGQKHPREDVIVLYKNTPLTCYQCIDKLIAMFTTLFVCNLFIFSFACFSSYSSAWHISFSIIQSGHGTAQHNIANIVCRVALTKARSSKGVLHNVNATIVIASRQIPVDCTTGKARIDCDSIMQDRWLSSAESRITMTS